MNSRNIEKSFLVHLVLFVLLFMFINNKYGYNIVDESYKMIDNFETFSLLEKEVTLNQIINDPKSYDMDKYDIAEYSAYYDDMLEEMLFKMHYYMPAMFGLAILLFVLIENAIYRRLKLSYMCLSYDARKDKNKERLKNIIREKLNYKYRRLVMPKHIALCTVVSFIASIALPSDAEVLVRTFDNMSFAFAIILTIYGIRSVIRFFRVRSEIARWIIILINILIAFYIPALYFVIGFMRSMFSVKLIIKKIDD